MSKTKQRSRAKLLTTVLLVTAAVAGCSSDDAYLPALLADPMAAYEADGIVLIDSWERPEGHSLVTDKPVHAEVGRRYRIVDESRAEQLVAEAAAVAESEGWRLNAPRDDPPTGFRGAKRLVSGDARLIVSLVPEAPSRDSEGTRILRVILDFGSVRFDEATTSVVGNG